MWMLPTLIQRYDKKSFKFKNERLTEILQAISCTFYHNNCHLLCQVLVILKVIFANSVDPVQMAPIGAV